MQPMHGVEFDLHLKESGHNSVSTSAKFVWCAKAHRLIDTYQQSRLCLINYCFFFCQVHVPEAPVMVVRFVVHVMSCRIRMTCKLVLPVLPLARSLKLDSAGPSRLQVTLCEFIAVFLFVSTY